MNHITIIDNQWRLAYDGSQYLIEEFIKGGKEVKLPRTGETIITEDKWKHTGQYYQNINNAVRWVCNHVASEEASSLTDFISKYDEMSHSILEGLSRR